MITTVAMVKTLLGITDTSQDARITALLPMVENDVIEYCNNHFIVQAVGMGGTMDLKVAAGPVYTIECADGGFSDTGIAASDLIYLKGSVRNDGYFTVSNITDTVITVSERLYAETDVSVSVSLVSFPAALPSYVAQMVSYRLDYIKDAGLTSETIKSYSYSRQADSDSNGYPTEIMRGLDRWRFVKVVVGRKREQYNDQRGTWTGALV